MNKDVLQRLNAATTDAEREAIALEMRLSLLPTDVKSAVSAAAIPHWFDAFYLEALLGNDSDDIYAELLTLSFVEQVPGKGYAIHERTRQQLLNNMWQTNPAHFRTLSQVAANYCTMQTRSADDPEWEAEAIYHRLVSDPDAGVAGLRRLATKWANYEYHSYDEIERTLRWADEQIDAGRLSGAGIAWTRLWQAKLALIYNRPDQAAAPLAQIITDHDPYLAAEVAQTRGDLLAETGDQTGVAAAWYTAYALYGQLPDGQGQLEAHLVVEKMRQHGLSEPDTDAKEITQPQRRPSRNALQLIDNIHAAWIEGVLNTALGQENKIDLSLNRAGNQGANLLLHRREGIDRPVVTGQRLSRLFDAAERSLLILGAPGSGKTITLLQLLDELLQQARQDAAAPIPLLFNLSSFGNYESKEKTDDLLGWLVEQAYDQYRINRERTRTQLRKGQLVLLLDGLDELPEAREQRERCVTAINDFVQAHPCGLVVCSRIGDYEALQNELSVNNALVLQPLTNGQIEAFIQQTGGEQAAAMLAQVERDWMLREVLRSPLLLNLYPQAFANFNIETHEETFYANDQVEARRKSLFAAYVEGVFASVDKEPPTNKNKAIAKEKSVHWLSYLARQMQKARHSLYFIEEMQPTWLPPALVRRYRGLYGLLNGLIVGLIFALSGGFIVDNSGLNLNSGLISLIMIGIAGLIATSCTTNLSNAKYRMLLGGLIVFLIVNSPSLAIITLAYQEYGQINSLALGMYFIGIPFIASGMILSAGILSSWVTNIQLRERVTLAWPLWSKVRDYARRVVFYGLILFLVFGLVNSLMYITINATMFPWRSWPIFGWFGMLIGIASVFLDTPTVEKRLNPGRGVHFTFFNAFGLTLLAALLFSQFAIILDPSTSGGLLQTFARPNILPPLFTWFGGLAWCQHWALRWVIARQGWLPVRLVPWLDSMTALGLLRRVGGGYIFIHRSLLEYFAELEVL